MVFPPTMLSVLQCPPGKPHVWLDQGLAGPASTGITWELVRNAESQASHGPFESDPAFQQSPQKVHGQVRICAGVFSVEAPHPPLLPPGGGTIYV